MTSAPPPARKRQGRSFRSVAIGAGALGLLIVAVAATLYLRFVRYERVAAQHVPPGSVLALRLDVEQAPLYEPARRHLIPLLGGPSLAPEVAEAHLVRLEAATGLQRGDLREIVVARGEAHGDWVVVIAGIFPRGAPLSVLASALRAEWPGWELSPDGTAVVHGPSGVAVCRASDGAVILGSSVAVARTALAPNPTYQGLGLRPTGPGGFALGPLAVRELSTTPWVLGAGELPSLMGAIEQVDGKIELGERLSLTVTLTDSGGGQAARAAAACLAESRAFPTQGGGAASLVRAAADRAPPAGASGRQASLVLVWERQEVDQAFDLIAEAVQSRFP